jgi:hypothetical protein
MSRVLERLPCILWCKEYDNICDGSKPYRTGTPFCGQHLRQVFGIDADYSQSQLLPDHTIQTYGPVLYTAPEISHSVGTILLPHRIVVDAIIDNIKSDYTINSCFIKYLDALRADPKINDRYIKFVIEVLRNWMEHEVEVRENDMGLKKVIEKVFKEWKDALGTYTYVSIISQSIKIPISVYSQYLQGGDQKSMTLSDLPFLLQHTAIHILPSIVNNQPRNKVEYLPHTTQSNLVYTKLGYVTEVATYHKELFVQSGESDANVFEYFRHIRPTTANDRTDVSIKSLADVASKAYPKPIAPWNSVLTGNDEFDCCNLPTPNKR